MQNPAIISALKRHSKACYGAIAFLLTLLININLGVDAGDGGAFGRLMGAFFSDPRQSPLYVCEFAIFFSGCLLLEKKNWFKGRQARGVVICLAILLSLAYALGFSCQQFGTPVQLFSTKLCIVTTVLFCAALSCIAYWATQMVFSYLDEMRASGKFKQRMSSSHGGPIIAFAKKHPMATSSCIMLVCWLPLLIACYPGLFAPGDTMNQIAQFFGYHDATANSIALVDENVPLNTHHPVVHTALMGLCVMVGQALFGSSNAGYLLYASLQMVCVALTLGYAWSRCVRQRMKSWIVIPMLAFFVLFPWYAEYSILGTKDTLFACALLLFCISILKMTVFGSMMRRRDWLLLGLSVVGFCLFKKGYVCLAIIMVVLLIVYMRKRNWLRPTVIMSGCIALCLVVSNLLFPLLHISSGSPREILSIPAQQTARCAVYHDLTQEQIEAISKVFSYEAMREKYKPTLSDPVKNTYNKHATASDVEGFLKVWLELLAEYPGTCISATIMNYYGWFALMEPRINYGLTSSRASIDGDVAKELGFSHSLYEGNGIGQKFSSMVGKAFMLYQNSWKNVPLVSLFTQAATYIWALILALAYFLTRKRYAEALSLVPILLVFAITLVGPSNFETRYLFPIMFALVPMIPMCLNASSQDFGGVGA